MFINVLFGVVLSGASSGKLQRLYVGECDKELVNTKNAAVATFQVAITFFSFLFFFSFF